MSPRDLLLLGAMSVGGAVAGVAWGVAANRIARGCAPRPRTVSLRAPVGSAAWPSALVPLAAWPVAESPGSAVVISTVGLLLLGIAVCDERTYRIPHAFWLGGLVIGLVLSGTACGWRGVALRAGECLLLVCCLFAAAAAARRWVGRSAVGAGDYGVLAFVGSIAGLSPTVDVLIVAGLIALGWTAAAAAPERRRSAVIAVAGAAVGGAGTFGVAGAVVGSAVLAATAARLRPTVRRFAPAPFGACIAAAVFCYALLPLPDFAGARVIQLTSCQTP